jgi:hypothetical protein
MSATRSRLVDEVIAAMPGWEREICERVRDLIHDAEPEIEETIKFRDRPYFVCHGNVAALLAARDHVDVFIYDPIAPDPHHVINQGEGNATARAIQIHQGDVLDEAGFTMLIAAVVANNRAGGWRRLAD